MIKNNKKIYSILFIVILIVFISGCNKEENPIDAKLKQAHEKIKSGKVITGKTMIDQLIKSNPRKTDIYYSAMAIYAKEGIYKDAAEMGRILIEKNKLGELDRKLDLEEIAKLHIDVGIFYQESGDLHLAEKKFIDALALSPDSPELMNALGWFYADNDIKLDEALKLTQRAAKIKPKAGHIIDSLGWTYYKLGKYDDALKTMQKAVILSPDHAELRYHLGAVYVALNKNKNAEIELRKALFLDKNLIKAKELLHEIKKSPKE
ncbi:MAG: tetratricopeptide repeat protein [Armatimonadota bacterium]